MESKKRLMSTISSSSASVTTHQFNEHMDTSVNNNKTTSSLPAKAKESRLSSSDHGYFSDIFPPDSTVMRKYSEQSGPNWTAKTASANAHSAPTPDGMQDGGPVEVPSTHNKDWKPTNYYPDATESPYFGSSVHYGGREFYTSPASNNTSENTNIENSDDPDYATRGNWWKGSLYY